MSNERVHVPQWKHYPLLGWFHYRNNITRKILQHSNYLFLPRINPYVGFINHAIPCVNNIVLKRDVGTQTEPDQALELGLQIIKRNGL